MNIVEKTFGNKVLVNKNFVIPQAGAEVVPLATLASLDLNGSGAEANLFEATAENSIGSILVVLTYQALLTAIKSESARKEGLITRKEQLKLIFTTAVESGRSSAFTLVVCSALISVFPWLGVPFTILGVIGGTAMAARIGNEFWAALSEEQRTELQNAAQKAKVNLNNIIPKDDNSIAVAASPA